MIPVSWAEAMQVRANRRANTTPHFFISHQVWSINLTRYRLHCLMQPILFWNLIHDGKQFIQGLGPEQGDPGCFKIGNTLEDGCSGQMPADVKDAAPLIQS